MATTITENLEIEEGSDTIKVFSLKDPSSGLPQDLTGCIVEIQIKFEYYNEGPIVYRSDVSDNMSVGGLLGTIRVDIPWLEVFNTNFGIGTYNLYIKYPSGPNVLQYKGFVTIIRGSTNLNLPGSSTITDPFPALGGKGPKESLQSQSVVLATDHPVINVSSTGGLGTLEFVTLGALGIMPARAVGVRLYLGPLDSLSFTIADSEPSSTECVYALTQSTTGPNWDENLSSGQMMYITEISGTPKFRWI